ncbi:MAG: bacillithiol system redox-active protein YtxJ [Planctomycetota bacterium]
MPPARITTEAQWARALAAPRYLIFKHSPICPVSTRAQREYHAFLEAHTNVPSTWIDVIGSRALSRAVAEETGVRHESPQALLVEAGRVVWHASHGAITRASLAAAIRRG